MKHTRSAILHDEQAEYLEKLEPPRDPVLAQMEAFAKQEGHPISDPEVATFLAVTVASSRSKKIVEVYDYVDASIPMLARMFDKRLQGYKALGYLIHRTEGTSASAAGQTTINEGEDW